MGSPDNLIQEYKHLSNEKKEMVYHIALKYLKRDEESAKDVTQEVLLKWYQYIKSGNEIKHLDAWLAIVTKNTALKLKERQALEKEVSVIINTDRHTAPSAEDEIIDSFEAQDRKAFSKTILDALYAKNPKWHEIIIMAYVMERKHKDIAEHFGVSENAINKIISRATAWCRNNYDLSER